jgi:anhydro-N-acetylmuramic acid kinase
MAIYKVIGLMSGTSLDGLDIAYCVFKEKKGKWHFEIKKAETVKYPIALFNKLNSATTLSGYELANLNISLSEYWGKKTSNFIAKYKLKPDFISSHGHTVFHQPQKGLSLQIGSGAVLSALCKLPVICDFRTTDVATGGQGAPLVPIGDELLFKNFDFCLNLGGISNISFQKKDKRIAFDISACNILLNFLANKKDKKYDKNGAMARKGKLNKLLFEQLNQPDYFNALPPKSLGIEWIKKEQITLLEKSDLSVEDKLNTVCEHIAFQISKAINAKNKIKPKQLLVTGGGAFNTFLIERIKYHLPPNIELIVPDKNTVSFKEALIFAFLGVLRWRKKVNCLKSVTGAQKDTIGGCIYWY